MLKMPIFLTRNQPFLYVGIACGKSLSASSFRGQKWLTLAYRMPNVLRYETVLMTVDIDIPFPDPIRHDYIFRKRKYPFALNIILPHFKRLRLLKSNYMINTAAMAGIAVDVLQYSKHNTRCRYLCAVDYILCSAWLYVSFSSSCIYIYIYI